MEKEDQQQQEFGQRLGARRRERELSQEQLADLSGLHRTYVGQIERGQRNVSLHTIRSLAYGLDLPPAKLFQDS